MRFTQKFGELPLGYDHKYVYSNIGYNLKATDLQAAIGVAQLKKLNKFIELRKKNFRYLFDRLKPYEDYLILPKTSPDADPSWFAFPITVRENSALTRKEIVNYLEKNKIMTRMLFAGNLIKHPAYLNIKKRVASKLEVTDRVMNNAFFVGVYPGIMADMIEYVGDVFDSIMEKIK